MKAIKLENETCEVTFLPELGGKIKSLRSRKTDREFFFQDPRSTFVNSPGHYISHDISGFDECFPTVGESAGKYGQDHGLLWDQCWSYEQKGNQLKMFVDRPHGMPVYFERQAQLDDTGRLRLEYGIRNLSADEHPFIYSSHPILALDQDSRIELPDTKQLDVLGHNGLLKEGAIQSWPKAELKTGEQVFLNKEISASRQIAGKWFSQTRGKAAILFPKTGEQLKLTWDNETLPYMGLWLSMGVPLDGTIEQKEKWICAALEPCTMNHDLLDQVVRPSILAPEEEKKFWITWQIENRENRR